MNKVLLKGRVVSDLKTKGEGSPCEMTIMTKDEWKGEKIEGKNNNEFHVCIAWDKKGDWVKENIKKGDIVFIEGFLKHTKITYKIKDEKGEVVKVNGKEVTGSSIRSEVKIKNIEKIS